jgi:DNA-binding GntR family transcriptional regulator
MIYIQRKEMTLRASERAYLNLLDDIPEWRLPPGTVLAEVEQSERLGVSRTPLREALGRLTAEGLTAAHRGRGVVVTEISLDQADKLFELREALECKAAALAARRGDAYVFSRLQKDFSSAAELVQADDLPNATTSLWSRNWMTRLTRPLTTPTYSSR